MIDAVEPGARRTQALRRGSAALLCWSALQSLVACSGIIDSPAGPNANAGARGEANVTGPGAAHGQDPIRQQEPAALRCVELDLSGVGAPVPMRRLTRTQVERSVRDVLGIDEALNVSDERLATFASNVSTAIDASGARVYYDFAERVASKADLKRCSSAAACLSWLLDEVGLRLFRHPLSADQRTRYEALYKLDATDGARWALAAMLQSPSFLYLDEAEATAGYLDDYSVAARLALVLWGQNPDLALLTRAGKGELGTPEAVRSEAQRLLADARSQGGVRDFVDQWLDLRRLDDPDARPDLMALGRPVLDALRLEPVRFFQSLQTQKLGFEALLSSAQTVRLDVLAPTYGSDIQDMTAEHFALDPARRAGILTLPGVMAAHAHAGATSPTQRGYTVLASMLCAPPSPPPANVSAKLPEVAANATPREKLEAHFSDDTCAACHRNMDGLGFAFESIDWLGRTRSDDHGREVDDTAMLSLGGTPRSLDGAVSVAAWLRAEQNAANCVARQWAQYASGVVERGQAECLMRRMGTQIREADGLNQMMLTYLGADWFRRSRGAL